MLLTWHYVTRAEYDAAEAGVKTSDKIYFLKDTGEIMRGTQPFTESCVLYTGELPEIKAVGRIYINSETLEGKIWNGTAWTQVIKPVVDTVTANGTDPVSGKAVASYVASKIEELGGSADLVKTVAYVEETNSLKVTMADGSETTVAMPGIAVDLSYNRTTGKLTVKNAAGTVIGTGVNLDLERFVSAAEYDAETKKIILKFNDEGNPLEIDVGDLVDTYTAKGSETVNLTVTGNQFVAEVIVASDETHTDNLLKKTANGLYVAPVDLSGKVNKVANATAGNIATLVADGSLADSGKSVGGATLAETPSASVLATEAAVAAIRTALTATINSKMNKVDAGHEGEILVAGADGDAALSGAKVGGAEFEDEPSSATLATEAGVVDYVGKTAVSKTDVIKAGAMTATVAAASDTKVVSEKAIVDALTWKTTV